MSSKIILYPYLGGLPTWVPTAHFYKNNTYYILFSWFLKLNLEYLTPWFHASLTATFPAVIKVHLTFLVFNKQYWRNKIQFLLQIYVKCSVEFLLHWIIFMILK